MPSGLSPGSIFPPGNVHGGFPSRRLPTSTPRRLVTTAKATEGRCLIDDEEVQAQMLPPPLSGVNPPDQELDLSL